MLECQPLGRSAVDDGHDRNDVLDAASLYGRVAAHPDAHQLKVGGQDRYALVHIPVHWDGDTAVPVVLSFHSLGANAAEQRSTDGFVPLSDKHNFIVVYPQAGGAAGALGAAWNLRATGDVDYVKALLGDLERRECVDRSRVYATGLSYGGAMADLLACTMADQIAAVAPVSAYLPPRTCTPPDPSR
ncbi:MAG: alpha/beta hydrolase family esterase [Acidimicrobiia bacterium]